MSNKPMSGGFQRSRVGGITNRLNTMQSSAGSTTSTSTPTTENLPPPVVNSRNDVPPQNVVPKSSGVVRHAGTGNRNQSLHKSSEVTQPDSSNQTPNTDSNQQQRQQQNNRHPSERPPSGTANSATENASTKVPFQPPISYSMLTKLLPQSSDEILAGMLHKNFQLKKLLNDKRMSSNPDWILKMTKLLEKVTKCEGSRERIVLIIEKLPGTSYIEGVYSEVRKTDPITDQLPFDFIQSFLRISIVFLSMIPHSADCLTKIFERIELQFTKIKTESPELEPTKELLNEVIERMKEIEDRKKPKSKPEPKDSPTTTQRDVGPPPDDYRQLPIVPNVQEILSEQRTYLRENIVDHAYKDPEHYLDVHFRLLREDFVGPLRDGIQQYLSGAEGKNFNVRIYQNVRCLGPRLCPRSGIVYDIALDSTVASKISWVNSRRLIYGNLLVLTRDQFQTCAFVTVEDRSEIEKDYIIKVKKLEKLNNDQQIQMNLDDLNSSHVLTMIETTTYFEAYRPVLNALQTITTGDDFPLAPFLLQLTKDMVPPNYVTPTTTFDFTPLLVEPGSEVKAHMLVHEAAPARPARRGPVRSNAEKEFRINYQQSNRVERKYKTVSLLDESQWPTSDELHINPKQREALILALTNKVALIQGPPGTGKTFLGVRITEMLLHNRSVWCPKNEQSTPILMICHTNHALDQFLELIVKRLNIDEGVIRVGNRCQNPAVQKFSLIHARRFVHENRSIPSNIYHQKHAILDKKTEAEEALKVHGQKVEMSRQYIVPLSSFIDNYVIHERHIASLLAPYEGNYDDSALLGWLGLGYDHQQIPEDLMSLLNLEAPETNKDVNQTEEKTDDKQQQEGEEKTEEKQQQEGEEKTEEKQPEESTEDKEQEMNEEEEEELRRRDELDMEEEYFSRSTVEKPKTTESNSMDEHASSNKTDDPDNDDERDWQVKQKRAYDRRRLIRHIIQHPTTLDDQTIKQVNSDVWQLSTGQRHDLYRYWLFKYQLCLHFSVRDIRREYNQAIAALAEYHQEEDYFILKDSVIVAMTTTCAAKYHSVIERLQSKIVIVEEAAAIFEAHIITALSTKCEHLILIGDHVQLRPNPSVYRLGVKYHFDVSLFERFIKNDFPNVRLNIQHRMRPEISQLMRHFYDDLEDHISVKTDRPAVPGVETSVYFINHNNPETTVVDGSSKRNEFEAKYVIALAQYLIKQGYRGEQVTILVMYLGQRQYIAKQTRSMELLKGVRIMVTDNYQGEENDIIILSLVRSNIDKKIGFVATHNRICVALSRARCGLFVIGNMTVLAEAEDMWKNIGKSLLESKELGTALCLSCRQHSKDKFYADKPESFAQHPEGGCNKPCDTRLKCGHQCQLMCHNYDFEHKEVICYKKCNQPLPCGHPCTKRCHLSTSKKHDPCRVLVEKTIAQCGHKIRFQCARVPTIDDCIQPILKRLPCGHAVDVPCGIISSPSKLKQYPCPTPCGAMLACKHKCSGTCGECRTGQLHIPCKQKCERELICSHVCKDPCASNCPPCLRECETRCVHSRCQKKCGELCILCNEPCAYKCKHLECTRLCSEPCNRGPCNEPCDKKLKCGHDCIGICGEPCPQKCRICNKHIVQEILFGSEDEPDARFVFLPDCQHIIEVTALDQFVQDSLNDPNANKAIRFPECPRCKQKIRRCTRYMPIINQLNGLIAQVKQKILGNPSQKDINERRRKLQQEFERIEPTLKETTLPQLKAYFNVLYDSESLFLNDSLNRMTNVLLFINEIEKLLIDGRRKLTVNVFEDSVSLPLHHIGRYLLMQHKYRNFAEQQINDIEAELERIRRLIYIEALVSSLKQILKPGEKEGVDKMQYLTKKSGPFTNDDKLQFDDLVKKFEHLNNLPGLGITERERVAIVGALQMAKGHWYVCPRGHPYIIGECGGANQESKCPECGGKIGGQNHQLEPTNRHFGLMDGSEYAAWSDEANLMLGAPPN